MIYSLYLHRWHIAAISIYHAMQMVYMKVDKEHISILHMLTKWLTIELSPQNMTSTIFAYWNSRQIDECALDVNTSMFTKRQRPKCTANSTRRKEKHLWWEKECKTPITHSVTPFTLHLPRKANTSSVWAGQPLSHLGTENQCNTNTHDKHKTHMRRLLYTNFDRNIVIYGMCRVFVCRVCVMHEPAASSSTSSLRAAFYFTACKQR